MHISNFLRVSVCTINLIITAATTSAADISGQVLTPAYAGAGDLPLDDINQADANTTRPAIIPPGMEARPSGAASFFRNWEARVHAAQASQPHWMTPLVTVTPRLEQEVRYDQFKEQLPNGGHMNVYGGGKGLELIPTQTNEILINAPPYQERTIKKPAKGFNDWGILTIKQRLASADEGQGNYILSAFLGVQVPRGVQVFTNHAWMLTPTISGGVGLGDFDVQATVASPLPMRLANKIGFSIATNIALQYHLYAVLWPEVEFNCTRWLDGERQGLNQIYLTPGLILGRFPIFNNAIRAIVGAGYQYAISPKQVQEPANTPAYGHAWIGTVRLGF